MSTDAMHASVTSLTYVQLADALKASTAEQDARFRRFLDAADIAQQAASISGTPGLAEARAEMNGAWAEYKAQQAMTGALLAELQIRLKRGDYA